MKALIALLLFTVTPTFAQTAPTIDQRIAILETKVATQQREIADLKAAVETLIGRPVAGAAPSARREVRSWSGSGTKETEIFATDVAEWKVNWQASGGFLAITILDADTKRSVPIAANTTVINSGTYIVRTKPGRYYLQINSAGGSWNVTVEE